MYVQYFMQCSVGTIQVSTSGIKTNKYTCIEMVDAILLLHCQNTFIQVRKVSDMVKREDGLNIEFKH